MKIRDFFYLRRSDRRVLLVLLALGLIMLATTLWLGGAEDDVPSMAVDTLATDSLRSERGGKHAATIYYNQGTPAAERFAFDPNTADSTALLRLGLQPWQVRNIYKYRAAGGIYRRKEDFARVYGLTQKQYRELEPYIHISSDYAPAADLFPSGRGAYSATTSSSQYDSPTSSTSSPAHRADTTRRYTPKLKAGEQLDLNLSDTAQLKRVPGIGSYFARRIVQYRERLGGYNSVSQLRELPDFPEQALSYLILTTQSRNNIRRVNVNKLSLNELKRHPYINYYQARAITDYRRTRGQLTSLDQLRLLPEFSAGDLERLKPYVEY